MKGRRGESIGVTIAVSIIVAMVRGYALHEVANIGLLYLGVPNRQAQPVAAMKSRTVQVPARIATLVDMLDATPAAERPAIIATMQRPQFHVALRDSRVSGIENGHDRGSEALRYQIEILLKVSHLIITRTSNWSQVQAPPGDEEQSNAAALTEVQLLDGQCLLVTTNPFTPTSDDPVAAQFSRVSFASWLALSATLAVILSILATRRLASPLSDLAAQLEQIGGSGDGPPLPLRGPRELRITIAAINRMQERLHRFVMDRTQMMAAISHDLRTSLTRLRMRLELMDEDEQIQKLMREIDVMGAMIDSTLYFARDDAKSEPRTLVDVSALVEGICDDAADAGANVTFSGGRGVTLLCRPTALRRAISNLVDNAAKYGKSAKVTLTSERGCIVIAVEDEGPGIPPSQRERVFEPFYRLEPSRNPETGGVGLGLAVARSIAREHGGDIVLASRKGGGLIARLELPG